ncbi:divergent PAP2 family protein [Patescibacteria group bacterium]|nr:divergent PAP2 family protein [Patescibacteria group bacterium]
MAILIQSIKIIVDFFAEGRKRLKLNYLRRAGGFPSVHSGISSSITTLMGLTYGIESAYFAIALCFSFLFRYDAMNVRYEAGKHAQYINEIKEELKSFSFIDYKLNDLKERL